MFETLPEIKKEHVSGAVTGNTPSPSKVKTDKNTVIKYMEDNIDELPDSYSSKASVRLFDEIYNRKSGVLPSSRYVDLIETHTTSQRKNGPNCHFHLGLISAAELPAPHHEPPPPPKCFNQVNIP